MVGHDFSTAKVYNNNELSKYLQLFFLIAKIIFSKGISTNCDYRKKQLK